VPRKPEYPSIRFSGISGSEVLWAWTGSRDASSLQEGARNVQIEGDGDEVQWQRGQLEQFHQAH